MRVIRKFSGLQWIDVRSMFRLMTKHIQVNRLIAEYGEDVKPTLDEILLHDARVTGVLNRQFDLDSGCVIT